MGWFPMSATGKLAGVMSAVTGKSVDELDALDGKDGQIPAPYTLEKAFPGRIVFVDPGFSGSTTAAEVIDNGNGIIDGDDMVLIQVLDHGHAPAMFIGGHLSNLEAGYETSSYNKAKKTYDQWASTELPELAGARKIWAEIQRRHITKFSDFSAQAEDIFAKAFATKKADATPPSNVILGGTRRRGVW